LVFLKPLDILKNLLGFRKIYIEEFCTPLGFLGGGEPVSMRRSRKAPLLFDWKGASAERLPRYTP
jgi:hypothetical protein